MSSAKYHATKSFLSEINRSIASGSSIYSTGEANMVLEALKDMIPLGSTVRASFLKGGFDFDNMMVIEGVVADAVIIDDDEPTFIIKVGEGNDWYMKGSVLTFV